MPNGRTLGWSLDEALRAPFDAELARWPHVPEERGRRDDRRAREGPEPADAHPVRPVAVERGDRGLAFDQGVRALAEAGPAPRFADRRARGAKDIGDRFAAQARVGPLDVALHPARSRKDDELFRGMLRALRPRGLEHQGGFEQIAVPTVGARADERLVEHDPLARDLVRRKRVRRAEWLRDE